MKHHHVPQFLLAGWCGKDGRLTVYTQRRGRIVTDPHTPEHTAFEHDLYAISALPEDERHWVEREVMGKAVDGPASTMLKRLLAGELTKLDSEDRSAWARFIMAQWLRSPEGIAKLRRTGSEIIMSELERNPEEYAAARGDAPEGTLREFVEARFNGLDEIVTMQRVLPQAIDNEGPGRIIINMLWQVLDLKASKVDLLTSDRPAIRFHGLNSRDCMIMVPLDPRRLFVASHYDRGFRQLAPEKIARAANISTVHEALERVYATGVQHLPLVEKYLGHGAAWNGPA
jgi:hypothetical protein